MIGLAADHHADRDEAVIEIGLGGERDGAGDFECAGHCQNLDLVPSRFQRGARAGDQHVVKMGVEARFDDEDAGHGFTPEWDGSW